MDLLANPGNGGEGEHEHTALFSPSAFAEQAIEAVLPLLDEEGTDLKEGKARNDVVLALRPLLGHFAIYDAVMVHFMLDPAGNTDCETPDGRDNPRSHAIFAAREAIIDFACNARASSARCAEARAYLAEHEGDMDEAPYGSILGAISDDLGRPDTRPIAATSAPSSGPFL